MEFATLFLTGKIVDFEKPWKFLSSMRLVVRWFIVIPTKTCSGERNLWQDVGGVDQNVLTDFHNEADLKTLAILYIYRWIGNSSKRNIACMVYVNILRYSFPLEFGVEKLLVLRILKYFAKIISHQDFKSKRKVCHTRARHRSRANFEISDQNFYRTHGIP